MMSFRSLIDGTEAIVAPAALNALMAKMAEEAGFRALYLSGGSLGWLRVISEANLTLNDVVQVGIEIRTVCALPLIMDGVGGWGDPMHLHHTIAMAERAGFSAIEIEDQLVPKRAHNLADRDALIPTELMEAKIREAVAARSNPDFVVIARTDSVKTDGIEAALRRAERYRAAGADMLFVFTRTTEELRFAGKRLGPPLMTFSSREGTGTLAMPLREMAGIGYRIVAVPIAPLVSMYRALRGTYAALATLSPEPGLDRTAVDAELKRILETVGLERLLDVERRTLDL